MCRDQTLKFSRFFAKSWALFPEIEEKYFLGNGS
jgi:hypothetical protein